MRSDKLPPRALTNQPQAISLLLDLKSKITTQEDFADIAADFSDCGSARSGGDLGEFESGQMMKVHYSRCVSHRHPGSSSCNTSQRISHKLSGNREISPCRTVNYHTG